jgi:hypothetical protein
MRMIGGKRELKGRAVSDIDPDAIDQAHAWFLSCQVR